MPADRQSILPVGNGPDAGGEKGAHVLPFVVELWTEGGGDVETVLARVHSIVLGQAVFNASRAEYPSRLITLRRGEALIASTASGAASAQIS